MPNAEKAFAALFVIRVSSFIRHSALVICHFLMIFYPILIIALFLSFIAQEFIPSLAWLHGARVFLMPIVFFYGALATPVPGMLGLAFLGGFMWDSLVAAQVLPTGGFDAAGQPILNVEIALGWSIILYAALGAIMNGFRPLYLRGHGWEIHCLMCGPLISFLVFAEYVMITFRRGDFLFPKLIWWRIGGAGLIAMILAPIIFFILNSFALSCGWGPTQRSRTVPA